MIGLYIVVYALVCLFVWSLCSVASDADEQMEEMLRQKKAEDQEAFRIDK